METRRLTSQTVLTNYMPLPRVLLDAHLPTTAMVLYAMLLDRGTLSQKHDYTDFDGWIYVVYPIRELADILRISDSAVKNNLLILEKHGLIRKIRRSRKEANRIFLFLPEDTWTDTMTARKLSADSQFSGVQRGRNLAPNNISNQQDLINIYQHGKEESL